MRIKDFYLCSYYSNSYIMENDISDVKKNAHNLAFPDITLIIKHHLYFLNRLSSKEIYTFLISQKEEKTWSGLPYQKKFNDGYLDWKNIDLLVGIVTIRAKYVYLNSVLFKFIKIGSPLCSFCNLTDKSPYYLFYECSNTVFYMEPPPLFFI